jgi:hypothetical protein
MKFNVSEGENTDPKVWDSIETRKLRQPALVQRNSFVLHAAPPLFPVTYLPEGLAGAVPANLFLANPRLNLTSHLPWRIYPSKKTSLGTPASPGAHRSDRAWCLHTESSQSLRHHSTSHPRVLARQDISFPALPSPELPLWIQHMCQRVAAAFASFATLTSPFRARRCLPISFWSPRIVYLGLQKLSRSV